MFTFFFIVLMAASVLVFVDRMLVDDLKSALAALVCFISAAMFAIRSIS